MKEDLKPISFENIYNAASSISPNLGTVLKVVNLHNYNSYTVITKFEFGGSWSLAKPSYTARLLATRSDLKCQNKLGRSIRKSKHCIILQTRNKLKLKE